MGVRFRKSVNIAPGVKVNVGKKSVGVSVGGKYGGVSVNSKSGVHTRTSIPGTGISYTKKIGSNKRKSETLSNNSSLKDSIIGNNSLFLSEKQLRNLPKDEFIEYSEMMLDYAKNVSPKSEYIDRYSEELSLIRKETDRRNYAKNKLDKMSLSQLRFFKTTMLLLGIVSLALGIISLCVEPILAFIVILIAILCFALSRTYKKIIFNRTQ